MIGKDNADILSRVEAIQNQTSKSWQNHNEQNRIKANLRRQHLVIIK